MAGGLTSPLHFYTIITQGARFSKREKKAFKNCIREGKRWLRHILKGESLVKEAIEERIEGKRGR